MFLIGERKSATCGSIRLRDRGALREILDIA